MKRLLLAVALAGTCASAAIAAPPPKSATGEERVDALIVYGNDPCPRDSGDEIVICVRKHESERYRIPPNLRDDPNAPANQAWANKAESLEYVGRTGINSCSASGPGGFTGCLAQMIHQAHAERGETDVNMTRLIEEAREQRNATISQEATEGSQAPQQPITPPK